MNLGTTQAEIRMPQLAESVVSATVGKWLVRPGDRIAEYDPICEIITDKVNAEIPSTWSGTVLELLAREGETVSVGAPICIIETASADAASLAARTCSDAAASSEQTAHSPDLSMRSRISPAVRTLASEHGVDLNAVTGTGLGGRITRKDVLAYLETASRTEAVAQKAAPAADLSAAATGGLQEQSRSSLQSAAPDAAMPVQNPVQAAGVPVRSSGLHLAEEPRIPLIEVEDDEGRGEYLLDVTPIRHTIASRMRQSVTEIPHAWTMIEVDVTNLVMLRNKVKDEFRKREGVNLTYLAFLLKAVVNAIKDYPIMNSVWAVDKIIVKRDINISLAVGTEDSVMTPVIKKADQKNIAGLAREIDDLAKRTRAGKLTIEDMQGGTFTVNNTGSFGSILSYPIINYPQAAILTFESIVKRPVVINDMIAVRSMANLCLSLDHRILDGVICGRFLQRVKENLESFNDETQLY